MTKATTESTLDGVVGRLRQGLARAFETFMDFIPRGFARLQDVAPYAVIELILPGGSLIALTLWYLQRKRTDKNRPIATIVQAH